jgi:hypothetical protein
MTAVIVVQFVILLVLCVLVAGLLRAYATVLQRLHALDGGQQAAPPPFRTASDVVPPRPDGPPESPRSRTSTIPAGPGRAEWPPAHDVNGESLTGEIVAIRTLGVEHDTVLVFLSSGCAGCAGFWEQLADGRGAAAMGGRRIVVITKSAQDESVGLLTQLCPRGLDLVMSSAAWTDYAVPGSPYVVVVSGRTGRVAGEGSGTSLSQVSGLMQQATDDGAGGSGRRIIKPRSDSDREVDVDRALLAAGIGPGHPSLYAADAVAGLPDLPTGRRLALIDTSTAPRDRSDAR